jgi:tRNA pseudouridine55 synthase
VLVGRATRVQRFLMALPKRYEVTARFGATSSTGDPEGEIVHTGLVPDGALQLPVGPLRQRPHAYSAVKVGGRRAYQLARAGIEVELAEREIEVYRFQQLWQRGERRAFVIECSSGTYVRSLIADLGDAYCERLRRTRIGDFDVADADPERPIPLRTALHFLPEVQLDPDQARRVSQGQRLAALPLTESGDSPGPAARVIRLSDAEGLIALAELDPGGGLKPIVGFRAD